MLHLYITSAAYELGVQPGDVINPIAIIYRPGMYINKSTRIRKVCIYYFSSGVCINVIISSIKVVLIKEKAVIKEHSKI